MVDNTPIWKTNPDNSWRIFTHTDYKSIETQPTVPKEAKDKKASASQAQKSQTANPFTFSKLKPTTKGSVTCTPKGYGIIQSFNEEKGTITVKIEGQVYEFSQEEVLSDIPLSIILYNNSLKIEEIVYAPINSTTNEVIERLESSLGEGDGVTTVNLYSNGKEFIGSTETIEKLKIMPWTKLLGIVKAKKPLAVKRYAAISSGWTVNNGNILGITFTPSKTIKVIGFAMHKPHDGTLTGTANFYHGRNVKTDPNATKSVSISVGSEKEELEKIMFSRPLVVKAGDFASLTIAVNGTCSMHYGSGGKQICDGEGEVSFNFSVLQEMPYLHGFDSGPMPEIYYYI